MTSEAVHDCRMMQNFGVSQPYQSSTHVTIYLRTTEGSRVDKSLEDLELEISTGSRSPQGWARNVVSGREWDYF